MLGPEPQAHFARGRLVARHEIHLRVVEQRVLVEIRRPDRQPRVVYDADLCVHVQRPRRRAPAGGDRSRKEALAWICKRTKTKPEDWVPSPIDPQNVLVHKDVRARAMAALKAHRKSKPKEIS